MQKMTPSSTAGKSEGSSKASANGVTSKKAASKNKQKKRVKWKDHFGGNLSASKILENGEGMEAEEHADESSVSWSDRRKRDRLREKELLAKAKYVQLFPMRHS
jgi:hypothetical protein